MPVCRISSLALAGARRGEFRRVRSVLAERRRDVNNCTFLPRAEKEQFDYAEGIIKFKRVAPKCWTSPTPVMREGDGLTLAKVCIRRKDAFWEAHCVRVHTRREVYRNSHWAG